MEGNSMTLDNSGLPSTNTIGYAAIRIGAVSLFLTLFLMTGDTSMLTIAVFFIGIILGESK